MPSKSKELTLYQWPALTMADSVHPDCVRIQRILKYKGIPFSLKTVTVGENLSQLDKMLQNIPVLESDGAFIKENEIYNFIDKTYPAPSLIPEDAQEKILDVFMSQWTMGHFNWHILYLRWKVEENFKRITQDVVSTTGQQNLNGIHEIRKQINGLLDDVGYEKVSLEQVHQDLYQDLDRLELWLSGREFFISKQRLSHCDITLYSYIQALLDPSIEESKMIKRVYKNIVLWSHHVSRLTGGEPVL